MELATGAYKSKRAAIINRLSIFTSNISSQLTYINGEISKKIKRRSKWVNYLQKNGIQMKFTDKPN
jgi:hypothetical protein